MAHPSLSLLFHFSLSSVPNASTLCLIAVLNYAGNEFQKHATSLRGSLSLYQRLEE
jgi:hypothetical protein